MNKNLSIKPFLLRAYYEWIGESGGTPHLLVQAELPHVKAPKSYIDPEDGTILFNISVEATNNLVLNNKGVFFQARFDGVVWDVEVPFYAVRGLYAIETDDGIFFELTKRDIEQEMASYLADTNITPLSPPSPSVEKAPPKKNSAPFLRVITNEDVESKNP